MTIDDIRITTLSPTETRKLGEQLGQYLEEGSVFALYGDLGSGKTAFVQGLAKGLGVPDDQYVTSPTFTLINEYQGRLRLFHIDLYRLNDFSEMEDLGFDEILKSDSVVAIEWSEKLPENFVSGYIKIKFDAIDDTSRKISIIPYGLDAKNLIKEFAF